MRIGLILVLVVVVLISAIQYKGIRKDLAAERGEINAAWTQVEAALDERAGIVPDLVRLADAEVPEESATTRGVSAKREALRTAHGVQPKIDANARLDEAIARLMLCIENYPKVDRSKPYNAILEQLKEADYHIALARRKYNEAVERYNTRIALFPNNVVASLAHFGKIDAYFLTVPGAP
ncbi:MAG: LemA family protein [Bryobacteraceae bacterium]